MDCSEGGGLKRRYLSLYFIWEELHLEMGALSSFIPREFIGTDSNMTKSLFPSSVEEGATGVMPRVSPGPDMPTARVHQKPGQRGVSEMQESEFWAGQRGHSLSAWGWCIHLLIHSFRQPRIRSAVTRGSPSLCEVLPLMGRKLKGVGCGGAGRPHVMTHHLFE